MFLNYGGVKILFRDKEIILKLVLLKIYKYSRLLILIFLMGLITTINDEKENQVFDISSNKKSNEIKWIEPKEFSCIDDWLVESSRYEYLQSLDSDTNNNLNIEKFLRFLEDSALNIKICPKSKLKPAKSRRQRNRRRRETATPDSESFKFEWDNNEFFKALRKHSYLAKKWLKAWRFNLEQAKFNSDYHKIYYFKDIIWRFEKLRKIFDDNAIIETLTNKNKNDISKQIDLHGLRRKEALTVLKTILKELATDESRMTENKEYVVITGKGKHSKNGPVLRPAIENYLKEMQIPYKELNHHGGFVLKLLNYKHLIIIYILLSF